MLPTSLAILDLRRGTLPLTFFLSLDLLTNKQTAKQNYNGRTHHFYKEGTEGKPAKFLMGNPKLARTRNNKKWIDRLKRCGILQLDK